MDTACRQRLSGKRQHVAEPVVGAFRGAIATPVFRDLSKAVLVSYNELLLKTFFLFKLIKLKTVLYEIKGVPND
jgi:hypothetical protein